MIEESRDRFFNSLSIDSSKISYEAEPEVVDYGLLYRFGRLLCKFLVVSIVVGLIFIVIKALTKKK